MPLSRAVRCSRRAVRQRERRTIGQAGWPNCLDPNESCASTAPPRSLCGIVVSCAPETIVFAFIGGSPQPAEPLPARREDDSDGATRALIGRPEDGAGERGRPLSQSLDGDGKTAATLERFATELNRGRRLGWRFDRNGPEPIDRAPRRRV